MCGGRFMKMRQVFTGGYFYDFWILKESGSESFAALDRLFPLNHMPSESQETTPKKVKSIYYVSLLHIII